jgi:hypothetical protein
MRRITGLRRKARRIWKQQLELREQHRIVDDLSSRRRECEKRDAEGQ